MSLKSAIAAHEARRKTLTVFAPEPIPGVAEYFADRDLAVEWERVPDDGTGGFVVVAEGERFLGSVDAAALRALVSPDGGEVDEPNFGRLLDLLRDVNFSSFQRRQLIAAAHEFEDRAWRVGEGGLHTGFQREAALHAQRSLYADLATKEALDVHVYVDADWDVPQIPGVAVHRSSGTEIGEVWFVVFDGGGSDDDACALLAEERDSGQYYGFWTYDVDVVADVVDHLRVQYQ